MMQHNMRYHLISLLEIARLADFSRLTDYLSGMQAQLEEHTLHTWCDHVAVNAMLSTFAGRAEALQTAFKVNAALPDDIGIPDYDLCLILGNLLENALEASTKCTVERSIEVWLRLEEKQVTFLVQNRFSGELLSIGERLLSTKAEGGLGLQSVALVSAQYQGELLTTWEENLFQASVTLHLPE